MEAVGLRKYAVDYIAQKTKDEVPLNKKKDTKSHQIIVYDWPNDCDRKEKGEFGSLSSSP